MKISQYLAEIWTRV